MLPVCLSLHEGIPSSTTGTEPSNTEKCHTGSHWFQNGKQMFVSLVNAVWVLLITEALVVALWQQLNWIEVLMAAFVLVSSIVRHNTATAVATAAEKS
jgi:hypothetical protein